MGGDVLEVILVIGKEGEKEICLGFFIDFFLY